MGGRISVHQQGGIATITVSHPGKLGAMSRAMWRELRSAFEALQSSDIRCAVLRGEGANFCAGGDISEYPAFRFDPLSLRDFHEREVWGGLQAMLDCDMPLVAQIEGACMGAGLEMAACCDIRIAGESARFGAPIAKLGFPMAPREAALVLHAVGELSAREFLLQAAVLPASVMAARGFLNRVLPSSQVEIAVQEAAENIARLAPQAARMNKQSFRRLNFYLAQAIPAQSATHSVADSELVNYAYAASAEHREGIEAFLQKRPPIFCPVP